MHPSKAALRFAARNPRVATAAVHLWAESYLRWPREPHWVFSEIKSSLGLRLRRRARLVTGQDMWVDPFDVVGSEIRSRGCYEPETVDVFRAIVSGGMTVLDVGAHLGQYTLIASTLVGDGEVHSFEPDPVTHRELANHVRLNRCENVTCNAAALSDKPGEATLYLSDIANIGGNSLRPTNWHRAEQEVRVSVNTLDNYVRQAGIRRVDVIKADVEGAELLVLLGGARAIVRDRPSMILELSTASDFFGYALSDCVAQLQAWGYTLFVIDRLPLKEYTAPPAGAGFFNVLAVHSRRLAAVEGIVRG